MSKFSQYKRLLIMLDYEKLSYLILSYELTFVSFNELLNSSHINEYDGPMILTNLEFDNIVLNL